MLPRLVREAACLNLWVGKEGKVGRYRAAFVQLSDKLIKIKRGQKRTKKMATTTGDGAALTQAREENARLRKELETLLHAQDVAKDRARVRGLGG